MEIAELQKGFEEMYKVLQDAKRVLIVAHQRPDGDTIGSSLALWHWLNASGKDAIVFCRHEPADQFLFMAHANSFASDGKVFLESWDVIIVCDSGDLRYAGIEESLKQLPNKPIMINIDHHASNFQFGQVNVVDPRASSTAEMVFRFFKHNGLAITKEMATCLLTAVFTDTGGFSNAATNQNALEMAAQFIQAGASLPQVNRVTMINKSVPTMQIWGKVMSRLQKTEQGIVYTFLHPNDFKDGNVDSEAIEGLSNYLSQLQDARAVMVFHDRGDGTVKASLRTIRDDVDLATFAQKFNGGGHKKAAGFSIPGRLIETNSTFQFVGAVQMADLLAL